MYAWVAGLLGLRVDRDDHGGPDRHGHDGRTGTAIPRRDGVDDRAVVVSLFGRFVDELASGLPLVLMPTLQARLGLSVAQVGWLLQALHAVAAVVEPVAAVAIDVMDRRPLLVWGALGWAVSLLLVAGAPTYGWLVLAFVAAGAASGPLAHTTDVLLVEMHPGAEERIGTRQTLLDTAGALLAPAAVAVVGWLGGDPRVPLVVTGISIVGYAILLAATPMPGPAAASASSVAVDGSADDAAGRIATWSLGRIRRNVVDVLRVREARLWIAALFAEMVADTPALFEPVWLAGDVGASQTLVAVHAGVELAASLVGLALLDRWLRHHSARSALTAACVANLLIYPVWLAVPGVVAKIVLVVPLAVTVAPIWPLVRARALAAVPGRGGVVMALTSVFGVLPLAGLFGWVSAQVGLTPTMLAVTMAGTLAIVLIVRARA